MHGSLHLNNERFHLTNSNTIDKFVGNVFDVIREIRIGIANKRFRSL